MVSTLLGYRLYANNLSRSLERIETSASVKKDAQYYADHIGNVSSVDDFLNDYRLYSYAMKAYGLEDQIASKGLIRKVLESDLGDASSFANKLTDAKYRTFAVAFNFKAQSTETKVVQSTSQKESLEEAYSEARVRQGTAAAARTEYFRGTIGAIQSVDALLDNSALLNVVLGSLGVDPAFASRDFVRQALTGTLPDDVSVTNGAWLTLHDRFNFVADGSLKAGATGAQTAVQAEDFVYRYNVATGNNVNSYAAALNADYYAAKIATVTSASDLVADDRLFSYALTAFNLDPSTETRDFVRQILTSDPDDPASTLNQLPTTGADSAAAAANTLRKERYAALRAAFNFPTSGTVNAGEAQSASQRDALTNSYFSRYQTAAQEAEERKTSTFELLMADVNSVTDLLASDAAFGRDLLNYALKAFDIDPATTSLYKLRRVLTSDASDPNSYVNRLKDERFEKLAAAFNFDADGNAATQRLVQSVDAQTTTGAKYAASFGIMSEATKAVVKAETKSYLSAIGGIRSLDDFLADTKTTAFALKAYGFDDASLSSADLRKILSSDLGDPTSFANATNDKRYVALAEAFNFDTAGRIRTEDASAQTAKNRLSTDNLYLLQTLEEKAGAENEGVRLGLYFLRKAPDLSSTVGILADKPLLQVVKTALGLPDGFAQLATDRQIAILDAKLKVADFKDARKLDAFISRFAALYDVANAESLSSTSPVLQLLGASSGSVTSLF